MNDITYITYQTFPAHTANSLQTISVIKYMARNNKKVKLIFPDRSFSSNDDINDLQNFYGFNETFEVTKTHHNYPFRDYLGNSNFKKIRFHVSHFLWSKKVVKKVLQENNTKTYFTRSDWVFYFLNKNNQKVIYECHQISKLRKFIINHLITSNNCEIVYTNELLEGDFKDDKTSTVIHNAYDEDLFSNEILDINNKQVVFVGNLLRFGKDRNINFLIECFSHPSLKNYQLVVVGGPDSYKDKLITSIKDAGINNVRILGRLDRKDTIKIIENSEYGILINTSLSIHSTHHTSPLKYFEYLRARLKVVAIDFPAHRTLPMSNEILFFEENNVDSFIEAIRKFSSIQRDESLYYKNFSYDVRVEKILDIAARLEGLEPPTL